MTSFIWNYFSGFFQRRYNANSHGTQKKNGDGTTNTCTCSAERSTPVPEPVSPLDRRSFRDTFCSDTFAETARGEREDILCIPINHLLYRSGILVPPNNFMDKQSASTRFRTSPKTVAIQEKREVKEGNEEKTENTAATMKNVEEYDDGVNLVDCDEFTQAIFLRELARYYFAKYFVCIPQVQEVSFLFRAVRNLKKETGKQQLARGLESDVEALLHFLLTRFRFGRSDFVQEQSRFFKDLVLEWERR
jgi:hypothetical protein